MMTLDPECVRDVMIYLEEHLVLCTEGDNTTQPSPYCFLAVSTHQLCQDQELIEKCGEYNITYTVLQLWRNQMILLEEAVKPGEFFIIPNMFYLNSRQQIAVCGEGPF